MARAELTRIPAANMAKQRWQPYIRKSAASGVLSTCPEAKTKRRRRKRTARNLTNRGCCLETSRSRLGPFFARRPNSTLRLTYSLRTDLVPCNHRRIQELLTGFAQLQHSSACNRNSEGLYKQIHCLFGGTPCSKRPPLARVIIISALQLGIQDIFILYCLVVHVSWVSLNSPSKQDVAILLLISLMNPFP